MDDALQIVIKMLVVTGIGAFVGYAYRSIKKSNEEIKRNKDLRKKAAKERGMVAEERARAEKKRDEAEKEEAKVEAERKKKLDLEREKLDVWIELLGACFATLEKYCKDKEEVSWIVDNKIETILNDLAFKSQKDALKQYKIDGTLHGLGPFRFNRMQFSEWHSDYMLAKKQAKEAEEQAQLKRDLEKIRRANEKREAEEKRLSDWNEYKKKFIALNKAQQKNEIEWFKKKIVSKITINKDQEEEYIHELEMIMLAD